MNQIPISESEDKIGKAIVDSAFAVHKNLRPGLLESIYETCFCNELEKYGLKLRRQVVIPIKYDEIVFDEGLRLDVLVEELIICEIKVVVDMNPVFTAQLLTYLKLANKRLGYLINYKVPLIKYGIKRIAL